MEGALAIAMTGNKIYTTKDIESLPENVRAQLIDGKIYYMAPPNRIHQEILMFLSVTIANYIQKSGGNCKVYPAPFGVYLTKDNKNLFEPDISVICDRNKLTEKGCVGAPDWVIEIISPSNSRIDYVLKLFKYHSAGAREYWTVDPIKNKITVWSFKGEDNDDMTEYNFDNIVPVGIYDDFSIDFSQLDIS